MFPGISNAAKARSKTRAGLWWVIFLLLGWFTLDGFIETLKDYYRLWEWKLKTFQKLVPLEGGREEGFGSRAIASLSISPGLNNRAMMIVGIRWPPQRRSTTDQRFVPPVSGLCLHSMLSFLGWLPCSDSLQSQQSQLSQCLCYHVYYEDQSGTYRQR